MVFDSNGKNPKCCKKPDSSYGGGDCKGEAIKLHSGGTKATADAIHNYLKTNRKKIGDERVKQATVGKCPCGDYNTYNVRYPKKGKEAVTRMACLHMDKNPRVRNCQARCPAGYVMGKEGYWCNKGSAGIPVSWIHSS